MRNIRMIVAYDGTHLVGYQKQPPGKGETVQGWLEKGLSKVCNENITIYGASRTDSGVHAKFQVVTFTTNGSIPAKNLPHAMMSQLPPYIVVRSAEEIDLDWKPRYKIYGKEYIYQIHNDVIDNPLTQRYHWRITKTLNIKRMREGARALIGTHDFTTLQGTNSTPANPVKTIYAIVVKKENTKITILVIGDGFLYHMVRNIVGLLVDIGLGLREPDLVPTYLKEKNRRAIGKTAPPQGLCLEEIFFSQERMDDVIQQTTIDNAD